MPLLIIVFPLLNGCFVAAAGASCLTGSIFFLSSPDELLPDELELLDEFELEERFFSFFFFSFLSFFSFFSFLSFFSFFSFFSFLLFFNV